jgi:hypothetical protein
MNYRKGDRLPSYRFQRALHRRDRQCAKFARFSELRDFRLFQHNRRKAAVSRHFQSSASTSEFEPEADNVHRS